MAVATAESTGENRELTNNQLLAQLQAFYNFEPPILGLERSHYFDRKGYFSEEDFFAHLENTNLAFLIAETIKRFSQDGEGKITTTYSSAEFTAALIPVHDLVSHLKTNGFNIDSPELPASASIIAMDYTNPNRDQNDPEFKIVLPLDDGFHFDRSRRTTVSYTNKWRKTISSSMQSGFQHEGPETSPIDSINILRRSASFLIEAIQEAEQARIKRIGGPAAKWQIETAMLPKPPSLGQMMGDSSFAISRALKLLK